MMKTASLSFPKPIAHPSRVPICREALFWSHISQAPSLAMILSFCLILKCTEFHISYIGLYHSTSLADIWHTSLKIHFPSNSQPISIKHIFLSSSCCWNDFTNPSSTKYKVLKHFYGGILRYYKIKQQWKLCVVFCPWRGHQSNSQYTRPLLDQ